MQVRVQARLAVPMLAVALAVTPPILLYDEKPDGAAAAKRRRLPPWLGVLHALSVVAAVAAARFAIFDIVQWVSGARPEVRHIRTRLYRLGVALFHREAVTRCSQHCVTRTSRVQWSMCGTEQATLAMCL